MDSQQLVETNNSQNSQDVVLPKPPANTVPRHSIDAILGRAVRKRNHDELEQSSRDIQENTGNDYNFFFTYLLQWLIRSLICE